MYNVGGEKSLYGFDMRSIDKRRTAPGTPKSYDIKMLWQKNHEILGLSLSGMSNVDIADRIGLTPRAISATVNSELGQKKLSEMREERDGQYIDIGKRVAELGAKAMNVYEEIFDSDTISYNLKKKTSDTVLMDLGGHRAPTKLESRSVELTATLDEIEEFKRLGCAAAKEAGLLVELPEENLEKENSL